MTDKQDQGCWGAICRTARLGPVVLGLFGIGMFAIGTWRSSSAPLWIVGLLCILIAVVLGLTLLVRRNERDPQVQSNDQYRQHVYTVTGVLTVFGLVFLFIFEQGNWKAVGAGCILAAASFSLGALLGLLFGIPRPARDNGAALATSRAVPNNNLIQISDWLTQVLVGASLTQITKAPGALASFGAHYGKDVGSDGVAIFLLVHFLVSGFLSGYLFTRLLLQHAFHWADQPPEQAKSGSTTSIEEANPPPKNPDPTGTSKAPLTEADQVESDSMKSPGSDLPSVDPNPEGSSDAAQQDGTARPTEDRKKEES